MDMKTFENTFKFICEECGEFSHTEREYCDKCGAKVLRKARKDDYSRYEEKNKIEHTSNYHFIFNSQIDEFIRHQIIYISNNEI